MSTGSALSLDWAIREILACPACRGSLVRSEAGLVCLRCAAVYPIEEGVPSLVAGQLPPEIASEVAWYAPSASATDHPLPERHFLAHRAARAPIRDILRRAGCDERSLVLSVATGTGAEIPFIREVSERIVAVDIAAPALRHFRRLWPYLTAQAEASRLPFQSNCFDAVVASAVLHHIAGYAALSSYVGEFLRVLRPGGSLIAVEPNAWYPVQWVLGPLNCVVQRYRPGWRGLVPHERPLSPAFLVAQFRSAGVSGVEFFSTTFVHNRIPTKLAQLILRWEGPFRARSPFRAFGWWILLWGRKAGEPAV